MTIKFTDLDFVQKCFAVVILAFLFGAMGIGAISYALYTTQSGPWSKAAYDALEQRDHAKLMRIQRILNDQPEAPEAGRK